MSNSSDSTNQGDEFLKTLKIHNKDLDACFNDALAVAHLKSLLFNQAQQQLVRELVEQLPHKFEQDITRTQDGDLMCDTCGSDVFGGICACETVNGIIDQVTALLNKKLQAYGGDV